MPVFSGQLGSQTAQQGRFQLNAPGDAPYSPPSMPISARPWIVHLYNNDWSFRASLGAIIGQRPVLKQTLNSGFQPVTVELPTLSTAIQPGNLVVITEEGGDATGAAPAGAPVIGGIIEQVPDTLQVSGWKHEITITPFVAELGDAYLNKNYTTATDVAQMVRDAVAQTNHLRCTPYSVPNTGITAIYNFNYAPCLEVVDHARLIAGVNYSWFVDAIGVVWFQAINTTATAMFTVTPRDFSSFESNGGDISGLKNFCLVQGGAVLGATLPATATYNNATSQSKYGLRALQPPISVPGISDQSTLNAIATAVGGVYDRIINRVTISLPAYPKRILLGQPGGATMRYFSPSKYPMVESETGTGAYSPTYVVLDVETDGVQQKVTLGDVPLASAGDVSYQVDRLTSRIGIASQVQAPFVGPNVVNANGTQNPTGTGPRLVLDGSVPMVSANDGTYMRAQMGNLASYMDPSGVSSPQHYGFRALDASGNLVFDSLGLARSISLSGTSGAVNSSVPTTSTSYVVINSIAFSLARTTNLYAWAMLQGIQTVGVGTTTMGIQLDSGFPSGWAPGSLQLQGDIVSNLSTTFLQTTMVQVWPLVPAGSHTLAVVGKVSAGTWNLSGFPNFIILGG